MKTRAQVTASDLVPPRGRPARRARSGGFTLVELLVSMVAGLMVALAVVGLSREASNTFHEETRIASAEMQIRTAIDRLRADIARAAFMSTGNIYIDPQILTTPGTTINVASIVSGTYKSATDMSLYSLAGIRLLASNVAGGSVASTPLSTFNGLSPDTIEVAGNLTGVEVLQIGGVTSSVPAIQKGVGCGGTGTRINLNVQSSPAIWRLVGMNKVGDDSTYAQQLVNAFQPVINHSFIVRIVDNTTHKVQFAATCATTSANEPAAWPATASIPQPYIDLDSDSINLPGVSVNATINPVQIVRWQLQGSLINSPQPDAGDGNKYDLTRQYVDAKGALAGNPEVVAEYAVDLKFAFTIDDTSDATGNYAGSATSPIVVNAFEDGSNATITNASVAGDVSTQASVPLTGTGPQPQRIRSVRIRLVTRAPMQDRAEPLPVTTGAADYLYRYCLVGSAATCAQAGAPVFARTRTLISEVALPNQARFWYR